MPDARFELPRAHQQGFLDYLRHSGFVLLRHSRDFHTVDAPGHPHTLQSSDMLEHFRRRFMAEWDGGATRFQCALCRRLHRMTKQFFACVQCQHMVCFQCASEKGRPHGVSEAMAFARRQAPWFERRQIQRRLRNKDKRDAAIARIRKTMTAGNDDASSQQQGRGRRASMQEAAVAVLKAQGAASVPQLTLDREALRLRRQREAEAPPPLPDSPRLRAAIEAGRAKGRRLAAQQRLAAQRQPPGKGSGAADTRAPRYRASVVADLRALQDEAQARASYARTMFTGRRVEERQAQLRRRRDVAARMLSVGATPMRGMGHMTKGELALR